MNALMRVVMWAVIGVSAFLAWVVLLSVDAGCPYLRCLSSGVTITIGGETAVTDDPALPQQITEPVFGGIPNTGDPNVGGGVPGDAGAIVDLVPIVPTEVVYQTSIEVCVAELWADRLPPNDCFQRWSAEKAQGLVPATERYITEKQQGCASLSSEQWSNCMAIVEATAGVIERLMGGGQ